MASSSNPNPETKKAVSPPPLPKLTPEQIQQIIRVLTRGAGNTKKPKLMDPSTFHGENGINSEDGWPSCQPTPKE